MRWHQCLAGMAALLLTLAGSAASAGPLTVLTEELPPINFTDRGELTGLAVEVVREIMQRTGDTATIQSVPWARGYRAALEQPDTVLFSTARSEERERLFKWAGPVVRLSYVFYARRDTSIKLDSLDDARAIPAICTYRDDAREQFLIEQGFTNLDSSAKLVSCARKLMDGRVDLWLDSNLTAHQVMQQIGRDGADLAPVLTIKTQQLYIAFSRNTADSVVTRWQEALDAMSRDGTITRLHRKWLPNEKPPALGTVDAQVLRKAQLDLRLLTEDLPPLNYLEQGKVTGVSTEIMREALRRLDLSTEVEVMPWARGYRKALDGPGIALYSTVRTPQREALFKWVGPIGSNSSVLYARRGSGLRIDSLEDAQRAESIGTYKDDVDEQFLRQNGFDNIYSHGHPASIARNLILGRVQLWAAGNLYAPEVMRSAGFSPDQFEPVYTLRQTHFYIAFSRDTPDAVVEQWQQVLDAMRHDGSFDRIEARWRGGIPAPVDASRPPAQ